MFERDIPLSTHSNYKIGGPAKFFVAAKTSEETVAAVNEAKALGLPIFILGGGTNLLISDTGFPGLVLKAGFSKLERREVLVTVGSGVLVSDLLAFTIDYELSGLEWAGGLPGTVGGAVWGNAGAFKGEIKDSVVEVVSINLSQTPPRVICRTNAECQFGYRSSIFKENSQRGIQEVIVEIVFRLQKGERAKIATAINEKIEYRKARQPLEYPNVGSMFKNVDVKCLSQAVVKRFEQKIKTDPFPVLPTAVLIDAAGLKGITSGGAMISEKHPNFIVNVNQATEKDVKFLMEMMRREIKKQFEVELEQEVIFV